MIPKILVTALLLLVAPAGSVSAAGPLTVALDPARNEVLTLQPLAVTTLTFKTKERFGAIVIGSKIVSAKFNETARTLDLFPAVSEGRTTMNLTLGGQTFTFILVISNDEAPDYRRTYTLNEDEAGDFDMSAAASAPAMKPQDIDTIGAIRKITRAHLDPEFRKTLSDYYAVPIGKPLLWNGSPVTLVEANAFPTQDLIVLKVEWQNASDAVLYLDAKQVEVRIAGKPIRVTARQQIANQLLPGQMDVIWLFIQGYHLSPKNEWTIRLPPGAAAVAKLLKK